MKYLLLIVRTPGDDPEGSPEEVLKGWFDYTQAMADAGVLLAGEALGERSTARTVTPSSGLATDGPYAETKEHMGGFYLLDVADRAEAEAWALKMPTAGPVEVWPVQVF